MKFAVRLADRGSVEAFVNLLSAAARLCKKRCGLRITDDMMTFVTGEAIQENGHWFQIDVRSQPLFMSYVFKGLSDEHPIIVLEIDVEQLCAAVQTADSSVQIKLTTKEKKPHLKVEIAEPCVTHEFRVTVVPRRNWAPFNRPNFPAADVTSVRLPIVKTFQRIFMALKKASVSHVLIRSNCHGDVNLFTRGDQFRINIHLAEGAPRILSARENAAAAAAGVEENEENEDWKLVKLSLRSLHNFTQAFHFSSAPISYRVLSPTCCELVLQTDDANVSFVVGTLIEPTD